MNKYQIYSVEYRLGAYYDMRYMEYFTRYKFILGLSKYNEDDTVPEREEMNKMSGEVYPLIDLEMQEKGKQDQPLVSESAFQSVLGQMAKHIKKNDPFDKVVDEFLLNTYDNIDEQEFQVCKEIIWTLWDIKTPFYNEVVSRTLNSDEEKQSKLFSGIKEVEDTIQRLTRKGILFQGIDYICDLDDNGNRRKQYDEPHILIPFRKYPDDAIKAIGEVFNQTVESFFGPHIAA